MDINSLLDELKQRLNPHDALYQNLRAAVEKMELRIASLKKAYELSKTNLNTTKMLKLAQQRDIELRKEAERERDELKANLALSKSAYILLEACDAKLYKKVGALKERLAAKVRGDHMVVTKREWEALSTRYTELLRENAELRRGLEGAHAENCCCHDDDHPQCEWASQDVPNHKHPYVDLRCLALRKGK